MVTPASLEGDGLNIPFFQLLWNKDNAASASSSSNAASSSAAPPQPPPLRVPDTVVFQYGQPLHWYFTSRRGGKDGKTVTILRKRPQRGESWEITTWLPTSSPRRTVPPASVVGRAAVLVAVELMLAVLAMRVMRVTTTTAIATATMKVSSASLRPNHPVNETSARLRFHLSYDSSRTPQS